MMIRASQSDQPSFHLQAVIERIKEARYDFYADQFEQISQDAKDFISDLLQKSPE